MGPHAGYRVPASGRFGISEIGIHVSKIQAGLRILITGYDIIGVGVKVFLIGHRRPPPPPPHHSDDIHGTLARRGP